MSLLFNTLSRFIIVFLPKSKCLLISWLKSLSTVILEPRKIKCHCFYIFPFYLAWSGGTRCNNLIFFLMLSFKPAFSLSSFILIKNLPAIAGDMGSIPGLGRCPVERNGNPLQYSCLENSMDKGDWRAVVHGVAESDMTENTYVHTFTLIKRFFSSASLSAVKGCIICKSELVHISPSNFDSSLWFTQPRILHDVHCIKVK